MHNCQVCIYTAYHLAFGFFNINIREKRFLKLKVILGKNGRLYIMDNSVVI